MMPLRIDVNTGRKCSISPATGKKSVIPPLLCNGTVAKRHLIPLAYF